MRGSGKEKIERVYISRLAMQSFHLLLLFRFCLVAWFWDKNLILSPIRLKEPTDWSKNKNQKFPTLLELLRISYGTRIDAVQLDNCIYGNE